MSWIPSYQSLGTHRKTLRAASLLKIDRVTLVGHLHYLWWWGVDNVPASGRLGAVMDDELASAAEWHGDAATFVGALIQAGFIDDTPRGRTLHDWPDYIGKLLRQRAANRDRMRAERAKHVRRTEHARAALEDRRGQDRTEEKRRVSSPPTSPPSDATAAIDPFTAEFFRAWEGEMGQLVTPMLRDAVLDWRERHPAALSSWASEAIRRAVAAGARRLNYVMAILDGFAVNGGIDNERPAANRHDRGNGRSRWPTDADYEAGRRDIEERRAEQDRAGRPVAAPRPAGGRGEPVA